MEEKNEKSRFVMELFLVDRINKISNSVKLQLAAMLKTHGVSVSQGLILFQLHYYQGVTTQKVLGRKLKTPGYSISRHVDVLEQSGWVHRLSDPDSGRRVLVSLTHEGSKLADLITPLIRKTYIDIFSNLDYDEAVDLYKLLAKVP